MGIINECQNTKYLHLGPLWPPQISENGFILYDQIDAFDSVGWWVGNITGNLEQEDTYILRGKSRDVYACIKHGKSRNMQEACVIHIIKFECRM